MGNIVLKLKNQDLYVGNITFSDGLASVRGWAWTGDIRNAASFRSNLDSDLISELSIRFPGTILEQVPAPAPTSFSNNVISISSEEEEAMAEIFSKAHNNEDHSMGPFTLQEGLPFEEYIKSAKLNLIADLKSLFATQISLFSNVEIGELSSDQLIFFGNLIESLGAEIKDWESSFDDNIKKLCKEQPIGVVDINDAIREISFEIQQLSRQVADVHGTESVIEQLTTYKTKLINRLKQ